MRTILIAAMALAAMPAVAQNVGDGFACPGPGGDVLVTVGRIDRLSEMTARPQAPDPNILHVYMETEDDFVAHAAFEEAALAGCATDPGTPFDDVAFEEALDAYREAAQAGEAAFYTVAPGEAFALALEGG